MYIYKLNNQHKAIVIDNTEAVQYDYKYSISNTSTTIVSSRLPKYQIYTVQYQYAVYKTEKELDLIYTYGYRLFMRK